MSRKPSLFAPHSSNCDTSYQQQPRHQTTEVFRTGRAFSTVSSSHFSNASNDEIALHEKLGFAPTVLLRDEHDEIEMKNCDKEEFDLHCYAIFNAFHTYKNQQQIALHQQLMGTGQHTSSHHHNNNHNHSGSTRRGSKSLGVSRNLRSQSIGSVSSGIGVQNSRSDFLLPSSSSSPAPFMNNQQQQETDGNDKNNGEHHQNDNYDHDEEATFFSLKSKLQILSNEIPLQPRGNGGIESSTNHQFNELFRENNRQVRQQQQGNNNNNNSHNSGTSQIDQYLTKQNQSSSFKSTTIGAANRERDRTRLFRKFGVIPETGSRTALLLAKDGALIAQGYSRLVFGDSGPFFELCASNCNWDLFRHHVLRGPGHHFHEHLYFVDDEPHYEPTGNTSKKPSLSSATTAPSYAFDDAYYGENGDGKTSSLTSKIPIDRINNSTTLNNTSSIVRLINQFRSVKDQRNPPSKTSAHPLASKYSASNQRLEGFADFVPGRLYLACDDSVHKVQIPTGSSPSFNSLNNFKVITPEGIYEQLLDKAAKETRTGAIISLKFRNDADVPSSNNSNNNINSGQQHQQYGSSFLNNRKLRVARERAEAEQMVDEAMQFNHGLETKACSDLFFNLIRGRFGGDGDHVGIQRIGALFRFCQHDPESVKRLLVQLRLLDRCDENTGSEHLQSDLKNYLVRRENQETHEFDKQIRKRERAQQNAMANGTASVLSERRIEQLENSMPMFLGPNSVTHRQKHFDEWLFHRRAEVAASFRYCQNEYRSSTHHQPYSLLDAATSTSSRLGIVVHYLSDAVYLCKKERKQKTQKEMDQEEAERAKMEEERLILEKDPEEILDELIEKRKKQKMIEKNMREVGGMDDEELFGAGGDHDNDDHNHSSSKRSLVEKFRSKLQSGGFTSGVSGGNNNTNDGGGGFAQQVSTQGVSAALASANKKKQEMIRQKQLIQIKRQKMMLMAKQKNKSLADLIADESRKRPFKFHLTFGHHGMSSTSSKESSSSSSSSSWSVIEEPDPRSNFSSSVLVPSRIVEGVFLIEWTSLESFLDCIDRQYPVQEEEEHRIARMKREEEAKIRDFSNNILSFGGRMQSSSSSSSSMSMNHKRGDGGKSSSQILSKTAKSFGFQSPGSLRWCARQWFWNKCPMIVSADQQEKYDIANRNHHQNNAIIHSLNTAASSKSSDDDSGDHDDDQFNDGNEDNNKTYCYSREKDDIYPGRFRFPSWWKLHFFENSGSCKEFRDGLHNYMQEYVNKYIKKPDAVGVKMNFHQNNNNNSGDFHNEQQEDSRFNPLLRRQQQQQKQHQAGSTINNIRKKSSLVAKRTLQPKETKEDLEPFSFLEQFFNDEVYRVDRNIRVVELNDNSNNNNSHDHNRVSGELAVSATLGVGSSSQGTSLSLSGALPPAATAETHLKRFGVTPPDTDSSALLFNNTNTTNDLVILDPFPSRVTFSVASQLKNENLKAFSSIMFQQNTNSATRLAQACAGSTVVHPKMFVRQIERQDMLLREQQKREEEEIERKRQEQEERERAAAEEERIRLEEEEEERMRQKRKSRFGKNTFGNLNVSGTEDSRRPSVVAFSFLEKNNNTHNTNEEHQTKEGGDKPAANAGDESAETTTSSRRTSEHTDSTSALANNSSNNLGKPSHHHNHSSKTSPPFFVLTIEDSSLLPSSTSNNNDQSSSNQNNRTSNNNNHSSSPFLNSGASIETMIAFCRGSIEINIKRSPLFPHISPLLNSCASNGAAWTMLNISSLLVSENLVDQDALNDMQKEHEKLLEMEMEVDSFGIPIHDIKELKKRMVALRRRPFAKVDLGVFIVKALFETFKMESSENVVMIVEVDSDESDQESRTDNDNNKDNSEKNEELLKKHFNLHNLSSSKWFWKDVIGCHSFYPRVFTDESRKKEVCFHLFQ